HLACATPNLKVVEYMNVALQGDRIWYKEFPQQQNGMWSPFRDRPGLGLELNPEAVVRYSV
ncbi:MAG: mandelate racemase/muconate lactonizing enzyme family protein, partial [Chloroflexi bacterium]|nr:mandelate racemase/muconate lactonizing enzyme family protein [Chloroflexota bacterium]